MADWTNPATWPQRDESLEQWIARSKDPIEKLVKRIHRAIRDGGAADDPNVGTCTHIEALLRQAANTEIAQLQHLNQTPDIAAMRERAKGLALHAHALAETLDDVATIAAAHAHNATDQRMQARKPTPVDIATAHARRLHALTPRVRLAVLSEFCNYCAGPAHPGPGDQPCQCSNDD